MAKYFGTCNYISLHFGFKVNIKTCLDNMCLSDHYNLEVIVYKIINTIVDRYLGNKTFVSRENMRSKSFKLLML